MNIFSSFAESVIVWTQTNTMKCNRSDGGSKSWLDPQSLITVEHCAADSVVCFLRVEKCVKCSVEQSSTHQDISVSLITGGCFRLLQFCRCSPCLNTNERFYRYSIAPLHLDFKCSDTWSAKVIGGYTQLHAPLILAELCTNISPFHHMTSKPQNKHWAQPSWASDSHQPS